MIKRFLEWLLSFFKTKEEKIIEQKIKDIDKKLEEIDDEKMSNNDIIDYINK